VRRRTAGLATTILVLALATVAMWHTPAAALHHRVGPCGFPRKDGETIQHFSKRHIACAIKTFGSVGGGRTRAICIAQRESGLIPTATSTHKKYLGLYQHWRRMWRARYRAWTEPSWQLNTSALSGRTNAIVTIRMVHAAGSWKAAGWPVRGC
jgi:hypothetical protein